MSEDNTEVKVKTKVKAKAKTVKKEVEVAVVAPIYTPNSLLLRFKYEHLQASLQPRAKVFYDLAVDLDKSFKTSAAKTTGLRKLLESKDAFLKATL